MYSFARRVVLNQTAHLHTWQRIAGAGRSLKHHLPRFIRLTIGAGDRFRVSQVTGDNV